MSTERDTLMAEIVALRERLVALEQRVSKSERGKNHRSVLVVALLLLIGLGLAWWQPVSLAQQSSGPINPAAAQAGGAGQARDIVATSLKIVGADGKEKVALGIDNIGGFIKILGSDGKVRAALWTDDKGNQGLLSMQDENGKSRLLLGGSELGGYVDLYGKNGTRHVYLGSAREVDGGVLDLMGPNAKTFVHAGHDQEGGLVWVNGHDGKARASLWVEKGGKCGTLNLHHESGTNRVDLGSSEKEGAYLNLYGTNTKRQVALDCNTQWGGGLTMYTAAGNQLIYTGANINNGHGLFQLKGSDGTTRVEMFVDNGGVGQVQGINAANQTIRSLK